MKTWVRLTLNVVALSALLTTASTVNAGIVVTATEHGGNVVFSGGGTADLTALTFGGNFNVVAGVIPEFPRFFMAVGFGDKYGLTAGPSSFGPNSATVASSSVGDIFGVWDDNEILLPDGYISGTILSGTMTFNGATIASLGMTPGTYNWTWGSGNNADSFTLQVGTIPVPASIAHFVFGLAGLGFIARRRRRGAFAE